MRNNIELERARRIIDEVDLSNIERRLLVKRFWTKNQAEEVIRQYRNYLYLRYKYPVALLLPSESINEAWSAHILDTNSYVNFCKELFGTYLHNISEYNNMDVTELSRAFDQLNALYQKEFGGVIHEVQGAGVWRAFLKKVHYIKFNPLFIRLR